MFGYPEERSSDVHDASWSEDKQRCHVLMMSRFGVMRGSIAVCRPTGNEGVISPFVKAHSGVSIEGERETPLTSYIRCTLNS